jgi:hypothetical protein
MRGKRKMTEPHFKIMKHAIKRYISNNDKLYQMYLNGKERPVMMEWFFLRASHVQGDSNKWVLDVLYPYMNDINIQSALNMCMRQIKVDIYGRVKGSVRENINEILIKEWNGENNAG